MTITQNPKIQSAPPKSYEAWLERYRWPLLAVILLAAAGLRFFVLAKSHFVLDGDEAVSGLIARHVFSQGELAVFFYGQPYMAPTDSWLAAPFMAIFGGSGWVKIGPYLWSVLLVGMNWWVARLFFQSHLASVIAALLTAFPPLYFMVNNLRALGSFTITLVLGDLLLLLTYWLVFDPAQPSPRRLKWLWFGLGLAVGFSFYAFWLVAFYYGPVFFFLLLKDKLFFLRRTFALFLGGFFLGSLPFWWQNFFGAFETFRYFFEPKSGGGTKPAAGDVLSFFFQQSLPLVVGAENFWQPTSRLINLALQGALLLVLLVWLCLRWRGLFGWFRLSLSPARPVDMLLLLILLSPALYLFSGVGNNALALPGVDTTGRYLLPLMAVAPLLIAGLLARLPEFLPGKNIGLGLVGLAMLLFLFCYLWPYRQADYVTTFQSSYFTNLRPPLDNQPTIDYLKSQGVEYATCNHWVGNRLMLDAKEAVKCVDYYDVQVQKGPERFPKLTEAIRQPNLKVGFVLVNPTFGPTPLEAKLKDLGVTFTRRDISPYTIIIPTSRAVAPAEVVEALGYPY